jgi:Flp pilus assembly protein TadD
MFGAALVLALLAAPFAGSALAAGSAALPTDGAGSTDAAERCNEGLALAVKQDWPAAEAAYREAIRLKPDLAEAWNGLGHALKKQRKLDASVRAYKQALTLRPGYPQALEYLGEAYVAMGKVDEARALLEKLRSLDAVQAAALERAIAGAPTAGGAGEGGW